MAKIRKYWSWRSKLQNDWKVQRDFYINNKEVSKQQELSNSISSRTEDHM